MTQWFFYIFGIYILEVTASLRCLKLNFASKSCGRSRVARMEPCHLSEGYVGVSLQERRATMQVMLGVSLRARWDATLVIIINQNALTSYSTTGSMMMVFYQLVWLLWKWVRQIWSEKQNCRFLFQFVNQLDLVDTAWLNRSRVHFLSLQTFIFISNIDIKLLWCLSLRHGYIHIMSGFAVNATISTQRNLSVNKSLLWVVFHTWFFRPLVHGTFTPVINITDLIIIARISCISIFLGS